MVVEVLCDASLSKPHIEGGVEGTDDALCTYTLTMRSAAGCPSHALSTGWTLLIFGGIVFSAYCVGGIFWNIKYDTLFHVDNFMRPVCELSLLVCVGKSADQSMQTQAGLDSNNWTLVCCLRFLCIHKD